VGLPGRLLKPDAEAANRADRGTDTAAAARPRRAKVAALPYSTCRHTFRATGITTYLENGGTPLT